MIVEETIFNVAVELDAVYGLVIKVPICESESILKKIEPNNKQLDINSIVTDCMINIKMKVNLNIFKLNDTR